MVLRHAEAMGDKPAIVDGPSGLSYSYAQLAGSVSMAAGGLAARGFGRGDVLAILAPNIPEYAIAFHAAATAGGTVTTINPTYTPEEVRFQLNDSGAKLLLTIGMFLETAKEASDGTAVEEIFVLGEAESGTPFTDLLSGPPFDADSGVDPDNDVVVLP